LNAEFNSVVFFFCLRLQIQKIKIRNHLLKIAYFEPFLRRINVEKCCFSHFILKIRKIYRELRGRGRALNVELTKKGGVFIFILVY